MHVKNRNIIIAVILLAFISGYSILNSIKSGKKEQKSDNVELLKNYDNDLIIAPDEKLHNDNTRIENLYKESY